MVISKGIAYFEDGHAEDILDCRTESFGGFRCTAFRTESGTYCYEEFIHKISDTYSAKRGKFYKAGCDEPVDIKRIILV